MVILHQRNAQIHQRNAQAVLITGYKTTRYLISKKWEIISKLLRNILVILETEKLPSKIWVFEVVSLGMRP
jgi:hypothetical protein